MTARVIDEIASGTPLRKPTGTSLHALFQPKSLALVGATDRPGSVGRAVLQNLINGPFQGQTLPVNPGRNEVLGLPCFPGVRNLPGPIDLAVVVTPADSVPGVIRECVDLGCGGAVVISAGFKETGAGGLELERRLLQEAHRGDLRVIGPNCLGIMTPRVGLNATFAESIARPGNLAFISQSGALCTAILDWSLEENIGFSAFVSVGSMADVGWGDLIDHFGSDPNTKAIVLYMETVGDARSFMSAAREVALQKHIIVIKPGRTSEAAKAAASHTGSLAGSDDVLDAAFHRCGVLRVDSLSELFNMAEVLAKQPTPKGPRLTVVTNAGGPGVIAADAVIAGQGRLANLSESTLQKLNQILPPHWSKGNPVDVIGDATPDRYAQALAIAASDPETDGLLAILTPQGMTHPAQLAAAAIGQAQRLNKPLLASWMGGSAVRSSQEALNQAGIPTFAFPDDAARAFCHMWRYGSNLRNLYETPRLGQDRSPDAIAAAPQLLATANAEGTSTLSEADSKRLLQTYGIPVVPTRVAATVEEAVAMAEEMGYPVVLKLDSTTLTHKTDVGGVRLNLGSAEAVRLAFQQMAKTVAEKAGPQHFKSVSVQPMIGENGFELILGCSTDEQFGPVLLFGAGGRLVETLGDKALGLPPLNSTLARRMMERTRIYSALVKGFRGQPPADLERLEQLVVRFSWMVADLPQIREVDINPLFVSADTILALDARVVLFPPQVERPRLAVRPYPAQYSWTHTVEPAKRCRIRPIRPEDEPAMVRFHRTLSEASVYHRFYHRLSLGTRIDHFRLTRQCFIDYDRELALVMTFPSDQPAHRSEEIVAVARLRRLPRSEAAEFGILVSDHWQGRGLGQALMARLLEAGRQEGVKVVSGHVLPENQAALRICQKLGFRLQKQETTTLVSRRLENFAPEKAAAKEQ